MRWRLPAAGLPLYRTARQLSDNAADYIWNRGAEPGEKQRPRPTVLLLGYAGSPTKHLDQFADLYAHLGTGLLWNTHP